jgi:hypothetical protein
MLFTALSFDRCGFDMFFRRCFPSLFILLFNPSDAVAYRPLAVGKSGARIGGASLAQFRFIQQLPGNQYHDHHPIQARRRQWRRFASAVSVAKARQFAIPAVNVINTSTVNAVIETAQELKSPAIIQFSNGGAQFYAGKGLNNDAQRACIAGGIAGANHVHQLAELYGATVVLHTGPRGKKIIALDRWPSRRRRAVLQAAWKTSVQSHMLDLSEEPIHENIDICKRYLERMSKMNMTLE